MLARVLETLMQKIQPPSLAAQNVGVLEALSEISSSSMPWQKSQAHAGDQRVEETWLQRLVDGRIARLFKFGSGRL